MSIFKRNKYTKTYYQIIARAKERPKPSEYTEKHHIIPKCAGGMDTVILTFKEHWVCHHLLLKMVTGKLLGKMYYAFLRMGQVTRKQKRIVNSKMFERIKQKHCTLNSKKNHPMYGRKHSEESKNKMASPRKGIKFTEEHKKKISESEKGKFISEETKNKISKNHADVSGNKNPFKDKHHSDETKRKISESQKRRYQLNIK
jgi:hypothetical protein